ncbi:MAG: U32 family peptidase [Acidobacteria bacterium]|nr:U32 family peptidase [Acidobacteriota bacterium]
MASSTLIQKPEVLAPAGNLHKLQVAVRYGADAVYMAGPQFGLRQGADNLTHTELEQAVRFCHSHGAKAYVVLNGFLFQKELQALPDFVQFLSELRVDAVIASDLGVVSTVLEHSSIPVHISTQASVFNAQHTAFWAEMGAKRVILARETSISDAAKIKEISGLEVELFVHGSMCMAFSGRCTISNFTAGRDSNRGGCEHSCRLPYQLNDSADAHTYFSSKDLNGLSLVPELVGHGIDSLKIEGRMKSALYVASTVLAYQSACKSALANGTFEDPHFLLDGFSHRPYTAKPLLGLLDADTAHFQEQGREPTRFALAGHVLEQAGDRVLCQAKVALHADSRVEALGFAGDIIPLDWDGVTDVLGRPVQKVQPNQMFTVRQSQLQALMVLRLSDATRV